MTAVGAKSGLTAAGYAFVASAIPTVSGLVGLYRKLISLRGLLTQHDEVAEAALQVYAAARW